MITSVGYKFTLSEEQISTIKTIFGDILDGKNLERIPIFACVWFYRDAHRSESEMREWMRKKPSNLTGYIRQFVVIDKSIIAVVDCARELFYAIIYNGSELDPTLIKKHCARGKFVTTERMSVSLFPYINEV